MRDTLMGLCESPSQTHHQLHDQTIPFRTVTDAAIQPSQPGATRLHRLRRPLIFRQRLVPLPPMDAEIPPR